MIHKFLRASYLSPKIWFLYKTTALIRSISAKGGFCDGLLIDHYKQPSDDKIISLFLTDPLFQHQNENLPTRGSFRWRISWKSSSGWLHGIFCCQKKFNLQISFYFFFAMTDQWLYEANNVLMNLYHLLFSCFFLKCYSNFNECWGQCCEIVICKIWHQ